MDFYALLRNRIEPKMDNILRKTKMASGEIDPQPHKYWPSVESWKAFGQKTYRRHYYLSTLPRGKMEQILLAYGLPKETVAAIMILYRNTKVKVRSPDGDTEYFDIVAGVLQGDTLAPYLFIICLDYVLMTSIDKNQRKWLRADQEKKQKVPRKNNHGRRLRWWLGVTSEYA